MSSDATPLDTDFSEVKEENIEGKETIGERIKSLHSGNGWYGSTFLIVKKEDYDESKTYGLGSGSQSTRYVRTGIGSNRISAIVTEEWQPDQEYIFAKNGIYIPVYDMQTGELLFTQERYQELREQMRGMSFYRAEDFVLDKNVGNETIKEKARQLREDAKGKSSTEEKKEKVLSYIIERLPVKVSTEMIGDLSSKIVELIDTGSTGRGTNIPGDGDFDLMLKSANTEQKKELIAIIHDMMDKLGGKRCAGDSEFDIRMDDIQLPDLDEALELDVTSESKSLQVEYSSDLCVRDRLENIRKMYGEEKLKEVVDNIIVAKKVLKEAGIYKKKGSKNATEFGGFGGIGVENWILQNGGSLILAMQTFLDSTIDEEGKEVSFEEFKRKYPIYDYGQNHRQNVRDPNDHYINGLTGAGYQKMKEFFREYLEELGIPYEHKKDGHKIEPKEGEEKLFESILEYTIGAEGYRISDMNEIRKMMARLEVYKEPTLEGRSE